MEDAHLRFEALRFALVCLGHVDRAQQPVHGEQIDTGGAIDSDEALELAEKCFQWLKHGRGTGAPVERIA